MLQTATSQAPCNENAPATKSQNVWLIAGNNTLNFMLKQKGKYLSLCGNQTFYQCNN